LISLVQAKPSPCCYTIHHLWKTRSDPAKNNIWTEILQVMKTFGTIFCYGYCCFYFADFFVMGLCVTFASGVCAAYIAWYLVPVQRNKWYKLQRNGFM